MSPLQGLSDLLSIPGRCPGLLYSAPLGLKEKILFVSFSPSANSPEARRVFRGENFWLRRSRLCSLCLVYLCHERVGGESFSGSNSCRYPSAFFSCFLASSHAAILGVCRLRGSSMRKWRNENLLVFGPFPPLSQ